MRVVSSLDTRPIHAEIREKILSMLKKYFEPIRAWSAHRPTATYINVDRGVH